MKDKITVDLMAGGFVEGEIPYEIPNNEANLLVIFDDTALGGNHTRYYFMTEATWTPTPTVIPSATLTPSITPTPTPTPEPAQLLQELDTAWEKADWPQVIQSLWGLRQFDTDKTDYRDKLYDAYLNYGKALLASGNKSAAATQFAAAQQLDPDREEAAAELLALTPTPTPTRTPLPTAIPTLTSGQMCAQAEMIDARELAVDPDGYKGRNIVLTGRTSTVDYHSYGNYTWIQLMADIPGRPYDSESVVVRMDGRVPGVVRDTRVKVCGIVRGSEEVRRILTGATDRAPSIQAYWIE